MRFLNFNLPIVITLSLVVTTIIIISISNVLIGDCISSTILCPAYGCAGGSGFCGTLTTTCGLDERQAVLCFEFLAGPDSWDEWYA